MLIIVKTTVYLGSRPAIWNPSMIFIDFGVTVTNKMITSSIVCIGESDNSVVPPAPDLQESSIDESDISGDLGPSPLCRNQIN
jgi:hypothetical protein